MDRRSNRLVCLLLLPILFGGCLARTPILGQKAAETDRKLSTYAYIEEGDLVTFIVDVLAARDRDGQAYMPLEIAVSNRGLRQLRLTRESFTLIDAEGNRYPMAAPRELYEGYTFMDVDRQLVELPGIIFNKFAALQQYPSNFSPRNEMRDFGSNTVRDLVALPRHGYLLDLIYFPAPSGGIRDQKFEVFLDSPDLEDPIFVKFVVN